MMRLLTRLVVSLSAAALLAGCPQSNEASGPVDTCEKTGQQCRLGGGQLGVCHMKPDGQYECVSQH